MRVLPADAPQTLRAPDGSRFLYLLVDPTAWFIRGTDGATRWVGIAKYPVVRLRRHCNPDAGDWRRQPEKSAWIEALCVEGWQPAMVLLAVFPWPYILEVEDALIVRLRTKGVPLLNRFIRGAPYASRDADAHVHRTSLACEACEGEMNDA
jgi:hypothetical protein